MVEGHENIKMSNSIIDYVFRALGLEYLGRTDIVQVPPKEVSKTLNCGCDSGNCSCSEVIIEDKPKIVNKKTPTMKPEPVKATQKVTNSVDSVQEVLGDMMGDAPACDDCGHITVRNGSCYKCLNCGNSLGCS